MAKSTGKIVCLVMALGLLSVPAWGSMSTDLGTDQLLIFNPVMVRGYGPGPDGDGDGEGGGAWGPGDCIEDIVGYQKGYGPGDGDGECDGDGPGPGNCTDIWLSSNGNGFGGYGPGDGDGECDGDGPGPGDCIFG